MEYAVESTVGFGDYLPDVFGSTDLLGRIDNRAVVLDWKFGSGVAVEVTENAQLMFYAAAAMRTEATQWAFEGVTEVELIIVQPPSVKRWVTTVERIKAFEQELAGAVKVAMKPNAPLAAGDHCKWCAAKPVCPVMTGAVDRLMQVKLDAIPADQIAHYLDQVPLVEEFIAGLQALAQQMLTEGKPVVTDIIALNGAAETHLLAIAAALEQASKHPLALALVSLQLPTRTTIQTFLPRRLISVVMGQLSVAVVMCSRLSLKSCI